MKDIEDEIPFEVPEGWAWCRLNVYLDVRDGTHDSPKYVESGYPFVTSKNLENGKINFSSCKFISEKDYLRFDERSHVETDDILFAMIGSIGKPVLVKKDREFAIKNVALFKKRSNYNYMPYVLYWLTGIENDLRKATTGGMQPFISLSMFREMLIPIPPFEEQKDMVSRIQDITKQIDFLETSKEDLQSAIKHAKSKILDLAIHGKLVPQDTSEEPAGKLLEKIRAEKEAKIAAGELKRDKNDSYIYKNPSDNCHYRKYANGQEECIESEIAFSLPDSWQWVNLGGIFAHNTGKALNKSKLEGEYKDYITTSNVYWDRFELNNVSKMPFTPEEMKKCTVTKGDLLICEGGDVGRSNIWDKDYDICIQNHLHRLRAFVPVETKLFYYWLMLFKQHNMIIGKGIGLMGFSSSLVHNLLIPLPPLAEQNRIVSKIEEIFGILDTINNNLE